MDLRITKFQLSIQRLKFAVSGVWIPGTVGGKKKPVGFLGAVNISPYYAPWIQRTSSRNTRVHLLKSLVSFDIVPFITDCPVFSVVTWRKSESSVGDFRRLINRDNCSCLVGKHSKHAKYTELEEPGSALTDPTRCFPVFFFVFFFRFNPQQSSRPFFSNRRGFKLYKTSQVKTACVMKSIFDLRIGTDKKRFCPTATGLYIIFLWFTTTG